MKLWNRNFTLMVIGQVLSLFANNILHFALSLYILDLTGSGVAFGTITAISMAPTILFMPFGGVLADRVNRKKIMVGMDIITGIVVLSAYFPLFTSASIPVIAIILILLSIIEAFYTPCVQASVPVLQGPDNLVKANAIVNQIGLTANIVGAILGGVLYGFCGIKPIMSFSIVVFWASAFMEVFIIMPHIRNKSASSGLLNIIKADFKECTQFITHEQPNILRLMPAIAILNFTVTAMLTVGAPYIIRILLNLSSQLYGLSIGLISGAGVLGGLIAILLTRKIKVKSLYLILILNGFCFVPLGVGFILGVNYCLLYILTTVCLMISEICASIFSIFVVSAIEHKTPVHLLGKVMAFITTFSICIEPVGRAVYGGLFDVFHNDVHILISVTAIFVMLFSFTVKKPLEEMQRTI